MDVIRFSYPNLPQGDGHKITLAMGNFDGMHRGHIALLLRASYEASDISSALFLEPPFQKEFARLTSLEDKIRYAPQGRIDRVYALQTSDAFYALSPDDFIEGILKPLGVAQVVVGADFRFGKGAEGDIDLLRRHFRVIVPEFVRFEGDKIGSRGIREALSRGDIASANEGLGHPYEVALSLKEKRGDNELQLEKTFDYALPKSGEYRGIAYILGLPFEGTLNTDSLLLSLSAGSSARPMAPGSTVYFAFL